MQIRRTAVVLAALLAGGSAVALSAPVAAEQSEVLRGRLVVLHEDHLLEHRTVHTYELRGRDGRSTRLDFGSAHGPDELGGEQVEVRGTRKGQKVEVSSIDAAAGPGDESGASSNAAAAAGGPVKLAVILFEFSDKPLPIGVDEARRLVFADASVPAPSVEGFYADTSTGALTMESQQVFSVGTIGVPSSAACNYQDWGAMARSQAEAQGVFKDANFTHVAHLMPKGTCSFSGIAQLPGRYTWNVMDVGLSDRNASNERRLRGLIAHELGHNFDVWHGASLACTLRGEPVVLSNRCTLDNYGDPFTLMGYHRGERRFNAYQRAQASTYGLTPEQGRAAWPGAAAITDVTASGDFVLAPLGSPDGQQVLRVPRPGTRGEFYYVEYRQQTGYDAERTEWTQALETVSNPAGVTIRIAPSFGGTAGNAVSRLLDMTPGSADGFRDAHLTETASFDDGAGVRIVLRTRNDSSVTLGVTVPTSRGRK